MKTVYGAFAVISAIVRQLYLPNPFECFGTEGVVYNWIAEPILHVIAYMLVGIVYHRGDAPAVGSILYMIAYAALVGFLWLLGVFRFAWWWVLIVITSIILIILGIHWIKNRYDRNFAIRNRD